MPLVELARRYGFLIVEDVAYRELSLMVRPSEACGASRPDVVVQIGTTSKVLFPGVRLGWAVGPSDVCAALVLAKQTTDQCAGALGQRLFEEYARRGWLDEQLAKSRPLYASKWAVTGAALERSLPAGVEWTIPTGGFFTWLTLPPGCDARDLAPRAADQGVGIVPGSLFFADGNGGEHLRLSFSLVAEELIDEGTARLATLLESKGDARRVGS